MNTHERIAVLERLLERVKRNAAAPRKARVVAPMARAEVRPIYHEPPAPPRSEPIPATMLAADVAVPAVPSPSPAAVASARGAAAAAPSRQVTQRHPTEPPSGGWAVASPVPAAPAPPPPPADLEEVLAEDQIQELELSDEEIVDITAEEISVEAELPPVVDRSSMADVEIDFDEEEEQPPSSSRRPKVAASMDEALAEAAEQLDMEEREVPLKTPPPESGPQAAVPLPPGLEQPLVPAEFDSGVHPAEQVKVDVAQPSPTHAQLGQTIELEAPRGPELELDVRAKSSIPSPAAHDELEAALPQPGASEPALAQAGRAASARTGPEPLVPEVTARPPLASRVVPSSFTREAPRFAPRTFLELLDASLGLRGD